MKFWQLVLLFFGSLLGLTVLAVLLIGALGSVELIAIVIASGLITFCVGRRSRRSQVLSNS